MSFGTEPFGSGFFGGRQEPASGAGSITGSGVVVSGVATVTGAGTSSSTGTGAIGAGGATGSGSGTSSSTGTGAPASGAATVSGVGTVTDAGTITGSGVLVAGAASASGVGTSSSTGSGSIAAGGSSVEGFDTLPSQPAGDYGGRARRVKIGNKTFWSDEKRAIRRALQAFVEDIAEKQPQPAKKRPKPKRVALPEGESLALPVLLTATPDQIDLIRESLLALQARQSQIAAYLAALESAQAIEDEAIALLLLA